MKFVDVPVSPYTGTADVSVPIYTIKTKGIEVPISLAYHTGGIRLAEEAGSTGLGWALNAGGMISRTINDKDDMGGKYFGTDVPQPAGDLSEYQPANNHLNEPLEINVNKYITKFDCSYMVNFGPGLGVGYNFLTPFGGGLNDYIYDLEPDTYSYNFAGKSGKFIITRDKRIVLEKQDNIKVQFIQNTQDQTTCTFVITDEEGNKFYFNDIERVGSATLAQLSPSSWHLSKIVTQQNETIQFLYEASGTTTTIPANYQLYNYFCTESLINSNAAATNYQNITLKTIDFPTGQLQFVSDFSRTDLAGANKLNAIKLYAKTNSGLKYLNERDLYYSYFNPNTSGSERLRLDSIKEISGSNSLKPYAFDYNLPTNGDYSKHSYSIDHWGFYNGAGNTILIPSVNVLFESPSIQSQIFTFNGANREPSPFGVQQVYALQKITYPTGGSSVIDYEPNTYDERQSTLGQQQENPNVVLTTVDTVLNIRSSSSGTIDFSKIFPIIPNGQSGTNATLTVAFVSNYSTGWPYQDRAGYNRCYFEFVGQHIDLSSSNLTCGGPVCSIAIPLNIQAPVNVPYQWTAYYDSSAIPPADFSEIHVTVQFQASKTAVNNNNPTLTGGGLRVHTLTDYTSSGVVAKKRAWDYHYGSSGQYTYGKLMSTPSYVHKELAATSEGGSCLGLVLYSSSNTNLTSAIQGNIVGYSQVTEFTINPLNSLDNGKIVYNYVNNIDSLINYGGLRYPGIPNMGDNLNGSLLSKITYRNTGGQYFKVNESHNYAHVTNRIVYYSAKYRDKQGGSTGNCDGQTGTTNAGIAEFFPSIKSERVLQDSTQEITYDNDTTKYIVSSSKMFYDNPVHYQLTRQVTTDSRGNKHVSKVTYPQDYIVSGGLTNNTILDTLIRRNMLAETIEKRDSIFYRGVATGLVDAASFTKYKQLNTGTVVPDKMYKLDVVKPVNDFQGMMVSGNTISQDSRYRQLINFDGYDHVGNVSQYTVTDKPPVSIIWDYKRVSPIAQVSNADSLSVAYTSFEADGMGHWSVASATRVTTNALSGANAYNLGNGSISKSGLTATNNYIVSYWTTNTGPLTIAGTMSGYPVKGATNKGWTYYEHQITGVSTVTVSGTGNIDELRLYPAGGQMTTYTYDPLVGVTSLTDAKNQVSYYEYDGFQRLRDVRDQDGNIVKHVDYHYQGQ
ncbi:hypothetical protein SNE25_08890 [Mucilaginibacter sabulilitoris]|uniref:YD repeat-containing protein n=1 Tax=Mucilaginibacter sabulilitoris TaxID=1173583 RepID=A0ABZ0TTZ1_9SPHI|nr:hypothetical protein [Mucilaginibacter sabulilitoris]WPU95633.1 hypothetical protein SNE25_08890 [Mucilaginibacter sabulilitoris]